MPGAATHPNAELIARFYAALDRHDAATMIACYAPDATFSDPVFPTLDAAGVAAMWRMLCARGKDLSVVASDIDADAAAGRAHWVATYTYSATGRDVENRIDATFAVLATAGSSATTIASTSGAGCGRRSASRGCCSAGCRRCKAKCARRRRKRLPRGARKSPA